MYMRYIRPQLSDKAHLNPCQQGNSFFPPLAGGDKGNAVELTLTLQTCAEEKRVRVRQMWLRAASGRPKRT